MTPEVPHVKGFVPMYGATERQWKSSEVAGRELGP